MLSVQRELEAEHRTSFDLVALPTILQLHRSYIRDAAFPGKSASFSRQLAQKFSRKEITRDNVFHEFHQRTGLALDMIDDRQRLRRDDVLQRLRTKVVAQEEAVQAAADVVSVAKARLSVPERPLATLLFLGPTGVGKTQCARALASVMFSDPARLLRFDMNEFVTPSAVAQLVGTFNEPDGLLTAAVRRQPLAVVLLGEIEKAHPDVFDLLLQVTGEGRLTDALGRTADFSNTVVVMTSNLGTSATNQQLGLAPPQTSRRQAFIKAAESFFRPEFFNRLDRVIPFDALSREEMRKIAELVMAEVFQRDGLVRRRCALEIEPQAMERIVDAGYHPQFGARALKRAIERQLVQPVAASLAGVKPELPAVISIFPHPQGVKSHVYPLESVAAAEAAQFPELDSAEQLECFERFCERAVEDVDSYRPAQAGSRGLSPEQIFFYALKEQLHQVRELLKSARLSQRQQQQSPQQPRVAPRQASYSNRLAGGTYRNVPERRILREIQAADDIHDYLRESVAEVPHPNSLEEQLTNLRYEVALLHSMFTSVGAPQRVLVTARAATGDQPAIVRRILERLHGLFHGELSFAWKYLHSNENEIIAAEISGPGVWPLISAEAGVHVWLRFHEVLVPVGVAVHSLGEEPAAERLATLQAERSAWLSDVANGHAFPTSDPTPLGKIVRFYDEAGPTLDLRSGISLPTQPTPSQYKTLLMAGLELPPELKEFP